MGKKALKKKRLKELKKVWRNPPVPQGGFVIVYNDDWCGEYKMPTPGAEVRFGRPQDQGGAEGSAREEIMADDESPLKHDGANEYTWDGDPFWLSYKGTGIRISLTPSSKRVVLVQTFVEGEEAEPYPYHDAQVVLPIHAL